jgi:hypothetical protein
MNRHIDDILIEINNREDINLNDELVEHLKGCERCNSLLNRYLDMLDTVRGNTLSMKLTENDTEQVFENITIKAKGEKAGHRFNRIKIIAVAAAILLIIASVFYVLRSQKNTFEDIDNNNLISVLNSDKIEDLEIINDLELFSNLELIENLEELEELKEVLDDEI